MNVKIASRFIIIIYVLEIGLRLRRRVLSDPKCNQAEAKKERNDRNEEHMDSILKCAIAISFWRGAFRFGAEEYNTQVNRMHRLRNDNDKPFFFKVKLHFLF